MSKQPKQSQETKTNENNKVTESSNPSPLAEMGKQARGNFRIKVCGMTLPEQVNALDEMGVDFAGLFFIQSRRGICAIK
jgi:hypothetical protein